MLGGYQSTRLVMVEGAMTEAVFYWLLALELMVRPQSEARTHGRGQEPGARSQGSGVRGQGPAAALARTSGHWERFTVNVRVLGGAGGRQQRDHFKCQAEATSS